MIEQHLGHIFAVWTPWSVTSACLAGAAFGIVSARLQPTIRVKTLTFFTVLQFVFWIGPFLINRLATPATFLAGLATVGSSLQAVLFVSSMAIAVALYRRHR